METLHSRNDSEVQKGNPQALCLAVPCAEPEVFT